MPSGLLPYIKKSELQRSPGKGPLLLRELLLKQRHRFEDSLDHELVPYLGVDHEMEEMAGRPLDIKVPLYVLGAVAIHCLGQLDSITLAISHSAKAAHTVLKRRIEE